MLILGCMLWNYNMQWKGWRNTSTFALFPSYGLRRSENDGIGRREERENVVAAIGCTTEDRRTNCAFSPNFSSFHHACIVTYYLPQFRYMWCRQFFPLSQASYNLPQVRYYVFKLCRSCDPQQGNFSGTYPLRLIRSGTAFVFPPLPRGLVQS
jgi:hypothetical protein